MSYLAVALGSGLRYFLGVQLSASRAGMATFVANILASVVLGMMLGWGAKSPRILPKIAGGYWLLWRIKHIFHV